MGREVKSVITVFQHGPEGGEVRRRYVRLISYLEGFRYGSMLSQDGGPDDRDEPDVREVGRRRRRAASAPQSLVHRATRHG